MITKKLRDTLRRGDKLVLRSLSGTMEKVEVEDLIRDTHVVVWSPRHPDEERWVKVQDACGD